MIPVSNGHVLRALNIERKPLSVKVIISALCGQAGVVENLSFQFYFPELGETEALQQALSGCSACCQLVTKMVPK